QVERERRAGVGDRLVLADEAAQLLGEILQALFHHRVGVRDLVGLAESEGRGERDESCRGQSPHAFSSRMSGRSVFSSASGVIGPICLYRMTPFLSITKVSGTPYTP